MTHTVTAPDRESFATRSDLVGSALSAAWTRAVDRWLATLFEQAAPTDGAALVAVGGYGRGELSLRSDLDVVLLHDGRSRDGVEELAERIWYPIWDSGIKLGHAVRTVREAVTLAGDDLDSATALITLRHLGGAEALSATLEARALALWRTRARSFLAELAERVERRHAAAGEVAFSLEPDLKEGRGGLRDVHSLHWAQLSRPSLWREDESTLAQCAAVLHDVRVELHRRTGRPEDRLALEEQDDIADALGDADADALMRRVTGAARRIAWRSDDNWRRIRESLEGPIARLGRRERVLGHGLVRRGNAVHLLPDASAAEPLTALRAAAAAACEGGYLARETLDRFRAAMTPIANPWPPGARAELTRILGSGRAAIGVLEALDQAELLVRILPEWDTVRSRPQRNAYHSYTVDRHLCEAAANAAALTERTDRSDLLLVGTWLHDLGKGYPGDHTEVGMALIATVAARMGFDRQDVATLVAMVEHHLLLADVATRRDLDDAAVIDRVARQVGSVERLRLLAALTEADSKATGPSAWGQWKAELVSTLVRRVEHVLAGGSVGEVVGDFPSTEHLALVDSGRDVVQGVGDVLLVVHGDRPGLLAQVSGALALHGLDVLDAAATTVGGRAVEQFRVQSTISPVFDWENVLVDVRRAIDGRLALKARLAERARAYRRRVPLAAPIRTQVQFHPDDSAHATVLEVRTADAIGVLHHLTSAVSELDCTIVSAKVHTIGNEVIDSFYLQDRNGQKLGADLEAELSRAIRHALE